jgi:hypothetical protein
MAIASSPFFIDAIPLGMNANVAICKFVVMNSAYDAFSRQFFQPFPSYDCCPHLIGAACTGMRFHSVRATLAGEMNKGLLEAAARAESTLAAPAVTPLLLTVDKRYRIGRKSGFLIGYSPGFLDNINGEPIMLKTARLCVSLICACAALPTLSLADTGTPDARTLLGAQTDNGNWILPARTYAGNRYTTLTQINKTTLGN